MKNTIWKLLHKVGLSHMIWAFVSIVRGRSFLSTTGWLKSVRTERSIDNEGEPIPWITYPTISFLESRITKNMDVFEYGCGNSTLWWSKRVKSVHSCEHESSWFKLMTTKLPSNCTIDLIELDKSNSYARSIVSRHKKYNIVVVDGRQRVESAMRAVNALASNGVIIWDNTDREKYKKGIDYLQKAGFKSIEFVGMSPIIPISSSTTIFYKSRNCLGI